MADQDPKANQCTATSKTTGNRCKWRFKPATKDGQRVAILGEVTVGFHLL